MTVHARYMVGKAESKSTILLTVLQSSIFPNCSRSHVSKTCYLHWTN